MEDELGEIEEEGRKFVGKSLCGVEMGGMEGNDFVVVGRVGNIEMIRR